MPYITARGAWVARSRLTAKGAAALAAAGLRTVILQIDWQRSRLPQRAAARLREEQHAARAAGLDVWWWAWVCPTLPPDSTRRPSGPRALADRLDALVTELGPPSGFFADAEVGGRWTPRRLPELVDVAAAARAAGMPRVGVTSHGRLSPRWSIEAFDVGSPQLYASHPLEVPTMRRWLATWDACPDLWITLGAADAASTPDQMRLDLAAVRDLGVRPSPGALWWAARSLLGDPARLAAASL